MTAERQAEQELNYSDQIRNFTGGVLKNEFQGKDKKVLFVCSMGILRSATGARIYARKYNTRCAGTLAEALIPLTSLLLDWSDEVVFVNKENYRSAVFQFGAESIDYKCRVLNITDQYSHMHLKLIREFKQQYEPTGKIELGKK